MLTNKKEVVSWNLDWFFVSWNDEKNTFKQETYFALKISVLINKLYIELAVHDSVYMYGMGVWSGLLIMVSINKSHPDKQSFF